MRRPRILAGISFAALAALGAMLLGARGHRGAPEPGTVTIRGTDFAFDAPDSIPAGITRFLLVNAGHVPHQALIVRLDSGKTMADLVAAYGHPRPLPGWIVEVGGPNAVTPGDTSNATVTLQPGRYALLCLLRAPGGKLHFQLGMLHPFTVTASTAESRARPAPVDDDTVTLREYAFVLAHPVSAGHHAFAVRNAGQQPHMLLFGRPAPGFTIAKLMDRIAHPNPRGPSLGKVLGGVMNLDPGREASFSADVTPGYYVFICFVTDPSDGKPHALHGMVLGFTVR